MATLDEIMDFDTGNHSGLYQLVRGGGHVSDSAGPVCQLVVAQSP